VITTSGALGILIPPSIVMVMYSVATNTSVGQLFIAGIIPGLVLATMLGPDHVVPRAQERLSAAAEGDVGPSACGRSGRASGGLLLIVVVIGGIYTGMFTPTEAAAMSAVYAFFVACSSTRTCRSEGAEGAARLGEHERDAALHHHQRGDVLVPDHHEQIPQAMAAWMLDKGLGVVAFLLFVNILLLLAGNVMEPSSIVLIMAPILFPSR
jgi:C4-dicarboxylate transporter DctM subunit